MADAQQRPQLESGKPIREGEKRTPVESESGKQITVIVLMLLVCVVGLVVARAVARANKRE